jgi:hypothetical protein
MHRTLLIFAEKYKRLPRKIYFQLDNASDNKCRTVLAYCAYLVAQKFVLQAHMCFLITGHTCVRGVASAGVVA